VATVQASYYHTIATLGVGLAILLQYLAPALIVGWETMRGMPLRPRTAAAVVAAVAGAALLVGGVDPAAFRARPLDWIIGFGAAFTFAFYVVFSKRGLGRLPQETMLLYTFLVAALVWGFVNPPWRILSAGYGATHWWLFLALGIGSTLLPFTCFYAGLRRLPPAEAGVVATFEPVIAVLTAALFLGEGLLATQWAGAALVLAAALLASWPSTEAGGER
jgi:drug/metabolite transporter (DMT)-like permease